MRYAIQVNAGPGAAQAAQSAYQFSKAALAEGHEIVRVFFYHEGVYHGYAKTRPSAPEDRIVPDWAGLAAQHAVDLVLCVAAAQRRGLPEHDPALGFRMGGLGQWLEACLMADRVLVFGDGA